MTLAVGEAAAPVLAGLGAGIVLVLLTARLLASLLVGVAPHDPVAIASAALALLVVVADRRVAPGRTRLARRSGVALARGVTRPGGVVKSAACRGLSPSRLPCSSL